MLRRRYLDIPRRRSVRVTRQSYANTTRHPGPPSGGPVPLWTREHAGHAAVKAKPFGRPAAGLDRGSSKDARNAHRWLGKFVTLATPHLRSHLRTRRPPPRSRRQTAPLDGRARDDRSRVDRPGIRRLVAATQKPPTALVSHSRHDRLRAARCRRSCGAGPASSTENETKHRVTSHYAAARERSCETRR